MHVSEECQRLNERASRLYENGDYHGARRLWEEVLNLSPQDPQALQGQRLVSILAEPWSPGGEGEPATQDTADRAAEVERLLESGRVNEAMQAAQQLLNERPDDPFAQQIHSTALRAWEAEPFIREHIVRGRSLLAEGRKDEARGCCRKVLALDELNREAQELLREIECPEETGEMAIPPEVFLLDTDTAEEPAAGSSLVRAAESVTGGLIEMPRPEDLLELKLGSLDFNSLDQEIERLHSLSEVVKEDAGRPARAPREVRSETIPPWENGTEATRSMGAAGDAGFGTVGEPAAAEALEGDFEPDGSFEFPARSESASVATGEAEPGASWEIPADGPEIAEALGQARRDLDAGLFEQAIGTASRLLAMNPDSRDAADMLDQARAAQEHHVRQLEELLDEAHRHVDHERLEEAEETLRQLLALSPGHAEAKELLERVARERHRAEATVNVVVQPPEPQATPEPEGVSLQRTHSARSSSEPEAGLAFDKPMRAEPVGGPGPLAARARRSLPKLSPRAALAAAAAIVILGGGWYAWNSFSGGPPAPAKAEPAPVRRARNPEAKAPAPSPARQVQPELKGDPKDLLREGRAAWQAGRTEDAVRYLRAAVTAAPEDASARSLLVEASARLEQEQKRQKDLAEAKTAFAGTRYSDALRIWYRLPESEQKGDLLLAMRNAWFNMAVEDLQIGDCRDASNHFGEVLQLKPADKDAQEGKKMAESYMDRPKDVAFVSFANSLASRAIDAD